MSTYARPSTAGPRARPSRLTRQGTQGGLQRCLFLVAVDGSEISTRGLRLAAHMMNPERDIIKAITVEMPTNANEAAATVEASMKAAALGQQKLPAQQILLNARSELLKCGVEQYQLQTQLLQLDDGVECSNRNQALAAVAALLVREANRNLRRATGLLVLGAAGIGQAQKGQGNKAVGMGPVAQYVVQKAKCAITLCKEAQIDLDGPLRSTRVPLHVVVCVDGSATARAAYDNAIRFCKAGDVLSVLNVVSQSHERQEAVASARIQQQWNDECAKLSATRDGLTVQFAPEAMQSRSVVDVILQYITRNKCQLCVMGSLELMKVDQTAVLGSVAQAVAMRSKAHCCIVKGYGQEESSFLM